MGSFVGGIEQALAHPTVPVPFEDFFESESTRLFRALIVVTRNAHDAEDIMQEAFVKVFERWDRVSRMDDPAGYLFRTALNTYFKASRTVMRAARVGREVGAAQDPLQQLEAREILHGALLQLPARQRAAVVVTQYLGYDSAGAGEILGIRAGTVRRLLSQARRRLAEQTQLEGELWAD